MDQKDQNAIDTLLIEAGAQEDGYLAVARVLPQRRERQMGTHGVAAPRELHRWLDRLMTPVDPGERLRIRLYRHGGALVRGVVVRKVAPCERCGELVELVNRQTDRIERLADARDDAEEQLRALTTSLSQAKRELRSANRRLQAEQRRVSSWRDQAEEGRALVDMVNAMEWP